MRAVEIEEEQPLGKIGVELFADRQKAFPGGF
jgi:hypothetical protein